MNSLTTQLTLDDFGRETARAITGIACSNTNTNTSSNPSVLTIEQTFALNNQVLTRTTTRDGATLRKETYDYDERNRLKHWSCDKTGTELPRDRYGNSMIDQVFEMDPLGNITQVTTTFSDNSSNKATYTYTNPSDPFQLVTLTNTHTSYPATVSPKYDTAGRITEDGIARSFTYDALGRVEHVENKITKKSADYAYDAHDRLCKQTRKDTSAEPTYFYYRGDQLVNLVQGTDKKRLFRTSVGFTAQINESGENAGVWLAGTDALGSVLSGGNGEKTENRRYAPYGEEKSGESALALGYTGAFEDSVSEAYPLGNGYRFYIPELMRFNAPDSLSPFGAGGINPYAYCAGDPINHSDPSGHAINWEGWLGIGFGILGILGAVFSGGALAIIGGILGGIAAVSGAISQALPDKDVQAKEGLGIFSVVIGVASLFLDAADSLTTLSQYFAREGGPDAEMLEALHGISRRSKKSRAPVRSRTQTGGNASKGVESSGEESAGESAEEEGPFEANAGDGVRVQARTFAYLRQARADIATREDRDYKIFQGEAFRIPRGATRRRLNNGEEFLGGGGDPDIIRSEVRTLSGSYFTRNFEEALHPNVSGVRFMGAVKRNVSGRQINYDEGYVVYMNRDGQAVHPTTGAVFGNGINALRDPMRHIKPGKHWQ